MGDQVEGKVERADRDDDSHRDTQRESELGCVAGRCVERDGFAAQALRFLGGPGDGLDAPVDFCPRLFNDLALFGREYSGEFFVAFPDQVYGLHQDGIAVEGRNRFLCLEAALGAFDGEGYVFHACLRHGIDDRAVVRVEN